MEAAEQIDDQKYEQHGAEANIPLRHGPIGCDRSTPRLHKSRINRIINISIF
jgi:hypothetical protein